jgi:hypothetical protein
MSDRRRDDFLDDLRAELSVVPSAGFQASLRRRVAEKAGGGWRGARLAMAMLACTAMAVALWGGPAGQVTDPLPGDARALEAVSVRGASGMSRPSLVVPPSVPVGRPTDVPRAATESVEVHQLPGRADSDTVDADVVPPWLRDTVREWAVAPGVAADTTQWPRAGTAIEIPAVEAPSVAVDLAVQVPFVATPMVEPIVTDVKSRVPLSVTREEVR